MMWWIPKVYGRRNENGAASLNDELLGGSL
jgi:hypothetical protein